MTGGPDPARDRGLQPERTRLAWRRTTLACAAVCALAVRQAFHDGAGPVRLLALALALLAWTCFTAAAHRRVRAMAAPRPPALTPRAAVAAAGCTVALAVFGALVVR
ncbi:DUF202 domain-containing protein [Streptomyces sp. B1866]|uniref:DUF202 domain-containing protein n=1 Tax=Streptomyces sp. B1866 TaxID=3075431 RepID=UPI002891B7FA|nr:DUF202 domain-containing protein [Streptomyces sp. B1866]MDT3397508.1 DUF202 domain-containing protein [Streptomyces sp. B1866]